MAVKKEPRAAKVDALKGVREKEKFIPMAKAWDDFTGKMVKVFEEAKAVSVELEFESSYDEKTHHTFNADEAIFVSDIKISPKGNVVFEAPYGSKVKTFHFSETELINLTTEAGETTQLNSIVNKVFRESFADVEGISSITILERKYLQADEVAVAALTNASEFVKELELERERADLYVKVENYGIF